MSRGSRTLLFFIMIIIIITGCPKEEKSEVQPLLSDKQTQVESVSAELSKDAEQSQSLEQKQGLDNEVTESMPNDIPSMPMNDSEEEAKTETGSESISSPRERIINRSAHTPTSNQRVVYTKLNSWNNDRDYYEIAFNTPLQESIRLEDYNKYIEFSPRTDGAFEKIEDKIVRFYPAERFKGDYTYKVKIDQAKLLNGEFAKVELYFYNSAPILTLGQVSLHPTSNRNEYYLEFIINHYRGRYQDSDYRNGLKIRIGSKLATVDNISYDDSGEMVLKSNLFTATENDKIILSPKAEAFRTDNRRGIYYSNTIKEMRKFLLNSINTVTDNQGKARIELTFSKNLDDNQSLKGLITLAEQEELAVSISKFMNKVIVSGNFELNKEYKLQINSGIKAADASVLQEAKEEIVHTYNRERELEFADRGVFLSSLNNNTFNIKVVNFPEVDYQLWAIQVENIAEMIHNINISDYSITNYKNYYRNDNLHWYGEEVKRGTVKTEVITDKDAFIKLDLGEVIKKAPDKIYILNLQGKVEANDKLKTPNSFYYYNYSSKVSKMLLFTDLALTAKAFKEKVMVNVVDVTDGSPVKRADVQLRSYNNTLLAKGKTDRNGNFVFDNLEKALNFGHFFVVAEREGALGLLSSSTMLLDNTKFNIDRDLSQNEYKLELFLDRPEYRPGETVNLSIMVRDNDNKIVKENLPIIATVYDPRNSKVSSEKITEYKEGFATYKVATQSNVDTGNWRIEVEYGNLKKMVNFSIETFVPERINVTMETNKDMYSSTDKSIDLALNSTYLFGAPLVGAKCKLDFNIYRNYSFAQEKFNQYSFVDEFSNNDYSMYQQVQELSSDENGKVDANFKLLDAKEGNHPYFVNADVEVTEEGGRPINRNLTLPVSPLRKYIGLSNNRYLKAKNGTYQVGLVVVDEKGSSLQEGTQVEFVIYGKKGSWWWDYDFNYRASFKKSESSSVITKGQVTIGKDKYITFKPQSSDYNLFIVEARIKGNDDYEINHKYFNNYWGDHSELTEDSSLELKTDKEDYEIGETVKVSIPSSKDSKIYLAIIKKDEIVKQEIIDVNTNGDFIYEFEADASMIPNVYLDVRVVQGQKNRNNDLPLSLYGIIPIKIIDKTTSLDIRLELPEKINSNSKLKGKIDVGVKKKTQYIVSIVDQGLINKSNYSIPNPWTLFYRNEGYFAQDYDNFSFFLNAQNLEIFRTIMIGGGMAMLSKGASFENDSAGSLREMNRLQETGVQRFKPVSYFLGILETDDNGKAEFEVDIADYIGALKVTLVAANEEALGALVKPVIVKDDIIAMPTLPRVLTPSDDFQIPVNVVIDPSVTSDVEIELITNSIVEVTSKSKHIIPAGQTSKLLIFSAQVKEAIGKAEFNFRIKSKDFSSDKKIDVGIRLPSAYQTDSKMLSFTGDEINYNVPELGYANSSQAYLSFTQGFEFDADQQLRYSIRYPYGGAVMKTATTFVQLLLSDFITDVNLRNELDANVNAYFQEIVKYNKQGLWEWQGQWNYANNRKILNAYALHTCLIAKEKGYNINEFVYSEILSFLEKSSRNTSQVDFEDAYILFVLALADKANIASLNYYNEQKVINIESSAVTMLEMAYKESGFDIKDLTKDLKADVLIQVKDNHHNYLKPNEEVAQALELYSNSIYNNSDDVQKAKNRATALALAKKMQSPSYWNQYEKGWNLFALAGFVSTLPNDYQNYTRAEFELTVAGKKENIQVDKSFFFDLTPFKNSELVIKAISAKAKDVAIIANNVFVPKITDTRSSSDNITLDVIYTDLDGQVLDVSSLEQGQTFYAEINTTPDFNNMEFATTYILPSCWEFSSEENNSYNSRGYNQSELPNYTDVRDDRVIIYGKSRSKLPTSYKCKINSITKGKFMMPATTSEDIYNPENQAVIQGRPIIVK